MNRKIHLRHPRRRITVRGNYYFAECVKILGTVFVMSCAAAAIIFYSLLQSALKTVQASDAEIRPLNNMYQDHEYDAGTAADKAGGAGSGPDKNIKSKTEQNGSGKTDSENEFFASAPETEISPLPGMEIRDMSMQENSGSPRLLMSNQTGYDVDIGEIARMPASSPAKNACTAAVSSDSGRQPLVLILHTHGTESFRSEAQNGVCDASPSRSDDITENVVAVGAVIADILRLNGIPAEHCEIMHDAESYIHSYEKSRETILEYLKRYPTIRYIFDIHRDAIETGGGTKINPAVALNPDVNPNEKAAQIMFVCGTDYKGADHPGWKDNLAFACRLQKSLLEINPRIARPINLRGASFNEQYTDRSLLVEIGSEVSTLAQAERTAALFASVLSDYIIRENNF